MKKIELTIPDNLKALSERQLLFYSFLLLNGNTEIEILTKCFCRFANISIEKTPIAGTWVATHQKDVFYLKDWEVHSFVHRLDFLINGAYEITPIRKMASQKHVNPRLQGTPFKQYLACENYYQAFIHTRNEHHLRCLAAAFYTNGRPFADSETALRAAKFKKVAPESLYTVFMWYSGLKAALSRFFPHFFENTQSSNELPAVNMRDQINGMLRALHGGDITKLDDVQNTETWQALSELDAKAREAQEMENQLNSIK